MNNLSFDPLETNDEELYFLDVETINATENTQGRGGGAIMEVNSWVYFY